MPKRKISLEEAFEAFHAQGLEVKVVGIREVEQSNLVDFIEPTQVDSVITKKQLLDYSTYPPTKRKLPPQVVRANLYTQHTIGSAGKMVDEGLPSQRIEGAEYAVYGPGVCEIPVHHAQEILHQDALAKQADERAMDRRSRQFIVENVVTQDRRNINIGIEVADLGSALGSSRFRSLGGL